MSKKKLPIWKYFNVGKDTKFAIFKACSQKVSRGGQTTNTLNTTNLVNHLKTKHNEKYCKCKKYDDTALKGKNQLEPVLDNLLFKKAVITLISVI